MNKNIFLKARETLNQEDALVKKHLKGLQDIEASIILSDMEIAAGGYNCYHYRPRRIYFHDFHQYDPYTPIALAYTIRNHTDQGIEVELNKAVFMVPYKFDKDLFDKQCNELFNEAKKDMQHCFAAKKRYLKEQDEKEKVEKQINSPHHFNGYTYHWEKCDNVRCSYGKITVGTGKYEPSSFYNYDPDYLLEVYESVDCPVCKGYTGIVVITDKQGRTKKLGCSERCFRENQNDLIHLMSECC